MKGEPQKRACANNVKDLYARPPALLTQTDRRRHLALSVYALNVKSLYCAERHSHISQTNSTAATVPQKCVLQQELVKTYIRFFHIT